MYNRNRKPTSVGEILKEEFLLPLGMSQRELANHINCDIKVINRLVNNKTSLSAKMAIKLGAAFSNSPEFWLNAQEAVDIYRAAKMVKKPPSPFPIIGNFSIGYALVG